MPIDDLRVFAGLACCALVALGLVFTLHKRWRRNQRRQSLAATPLTLRQRVILEKPLPWTRRLPDDFRRKLEAAMQVFLSEKNFEACGDLPEVTEEMRLVIAAQACLLIAQRPDRTYDQLQTILVYPTAFRAPVSEPIGPDLEYIDEEERIGESWGQGSVVLAWDSVLRGGSNHEDGLNVVIHEFAHQLDQANGSADGAPILECATDYTAWAKVFRAAYGRHVENTDHDRETVIDEYGAEEPAEFFAVATETFFERPQKLFEEYPEMFRELEKFYGVDPRTWR